MAFAHGVQFTEKSGANLYVGVGSMFVKAINPTKEELSKLYGREMDREPEYLGEITVNDTPVKTVRIEFAGITDPEKNNGIEKIARPSVTLRNQRRLNGDGTKVQVVDEYGRFAWVTLEQAEKHEVPMYKNGPANITANYREAYPGEEQLVGMIRAYLNIPNPMRYINNQWIMIDNPEEAEARLDHIDDYFKGDFSELKQLLSYQPNNKMKILFGVRTTDDNKQYQDYFTDFVMKNSVSDYSKLEKELQDRMSNASEGSRLKSTYFEVCPLKEYVVTPTKIESVEVQSATPASWLRR